MQERIDQLQEHLQAGVSVLLLWQVKGCEMSPGSRGAGSPLAPVSVYSHVGRVLARPVLHHGPTSHKP